MSNNNTNQNQTTTPDAELDAAAKAAAEAEAAKKAEEEAAAKAEAERIAAEKRSEAAKKAAATRKAQQEAANKAQAPVAGASGKSDEELAEELLAGTSPAAATDVNAQGSRKGLLDLLHEMFKPTAMVVVKNFTDFDTGWVYSSPDELVVEQPDKYTRRTYPGKPHARVLRAGQQIVVQGWEAYIGLTRFFKQYAQIKGQPNISAFMNSPAEHRKFIEQAYGGLFDPNQGSQTEVDARTALENDLGLTSGGNA